MHLHKGDSSYSQPPHSPRVRTRLPPPPAASLDPPHTEGGAGTGAAPGDCPLHRPNALLSPACPGKSHHPHGAVTRGWMALVLPGKRGGPSRTHPFQLCPQPLAHPAQDPCPCCFPAHHAGGCLPLPIRDPESGSQAGPWVLWDGLDTERSQGMGDRGCPGSLPTGPPHHSMGIGNGAGLSLRPGVHRASPSPRGTAGSLGRILYEHWPSPHAAAGSRLWL